jgi:uncharacterized membrane protein
MEEIGIYILAAIMLFAAYAHIRWPKFYKPMVPKPIPLSWANIFSVITEAGIAILLLLPSYRKIGGLAFMVLMIVFLPIHIWDLFRERPVMRSRTGAVIRLLIQFLLIYVGWLIWKN